MLDHFFLDVAAVLRRALDQSLLERTNGEDRLLYDLFSGDMAWETAVTLPGEADPPHVSADISLDWPAWSQFAWRNLASGETQDDPPEIGVEIVFRAQALASRPDMGRLLDVLSRQGPLMSGDYLERTAAVVEETVDEPALGTETAVEVGYEGVYRLAPAKPAGVGDDTASLFPGWAGARPSVTDASSKGPATASPVAAATEAALGSLVAWVASVLVQLADLGLDYLPPSSEEA